MAAIAATRKFRPARSAITAASRSRTAGWVRYCVQAAPERAGVVHPVLGEQGGGELAQAVEVEVGVAVEVDEAVIVAGGDS